MAWTTEMEYCYCVDANVDEPIMLLNKHIGYDDVEGMGIVPDLFQEELMKLDSLGKSKIIISINSVGGSVLGGMGIYNAILKTKTKVDTYNGGIAASIAAVIFQAGRTRTMADYSLLMLHNPFDPKRTDSAVTDSIQALKTSIVKMIATRSKLPEDEVSSLMDATTWINAEDAKNKYGLCDEVENSGDINKRRLSTTGDIAALWREASAIYNKVFLTQNSDMKNLAKILNLGNFETATEAEVLVAITNIRNQVDELTNTTEAQKAEIETKDTKIQELEGTVTEKDTKIQELETKVQEQTETIEAATETEATKIVEDAVNAGKITEESKPDWIAKGKANLTDVKNQLDSIQVTKKAPVLEIQGGESGGSATVKAMAKLQNKFSN